MNKRIFNVLVLLCLVVSLFAASVVNADDDKSIIIAMTGDVNTWNPWQYNEIVANSIQEHVFDTLIAVGNNLEQEPALATEWSTPDGGTTWDFTLREGVKFTNGNDFNADDVVYSFDRCKELAKGWADSTASIDSVEKIDDYHVRFHCNAVDAVFPSEAKNIMILDKETTEALDDAGLDATVVGTGRYKLEEYVRDDHTTLVVNEDYWGEKPEVEKVTFRPIPNDGTRTASLLNQEVDLIMNVPVTDAPMIMKQDFLAVESAPSIGVMFYNIAQCEEDPTKDAADEFKLKTPDGTNPMSKLEVRKAIVLAIDVEEIMEFVMQGYATIAPSCVPEGFNGYNPNLKDYGYDPEQAEALLDAAGYPRQADGYRFEMTITCTNDRYINDAAQAQAIAGYLDAVGIKCNVNAMSRSVFFNYVRIHDETDNAHFIQAGWSELSGESVLLARDLVYGTTLQGRVKEGVGGANRGYYNNPKVNELIDKALATADYDERDAIMQEVWQIVYDEVGMFTTFFTNDIYAVNKRVNFTARPDQFICAWNFSFN